MVRSDSVELHRELLAGFLHCLTLLDQLLMLSTLQRAIINLIGVSSRVRVKDSLVKDRVCL